MGRRRKCTFRVGCMRFCDSGSYHFAQRSFLQRDNPKSRNQPFNDCSLSSALTGSVTEVSSCRRYLIGCRTFVFCLNTLPDCCKCNRPGLVRSYGHAPYAHNLPLILFLLFSCVSFQGKILS